MIEDPENKKKHDEMMKIYFQGGFGVAQNPVLEPEYACLRHRFTTRSVGFGGPKQAYSGSKTGFCATPNPAQNVFCSIFRILTSFFPVPLLLSIFNSETEKRPIIIFC